MRFPTFVCDLFIEQVPRKAILPLPDFLFFSQEQVLQAGNEVSQRLLSEQ